MRIVGAIDFCFAFILCFEQSRFGKSVEFDPDGVGRFIKFFGEGTEVS
jgi:hypothetical protein